jgi:hypothetical protein
LGCDWVSHGFTRMRTDKKNAFNEGGNVACDFVGHRFQAAAAGPPASRFGVYQPIAGPDCLRKALRIEGTFSLWAAKENRETRGATA